VSVGAGVGGSGVGGSGVAVGGTGVAVGCRRTGRRVGTGVLVSVGAGVAVGATVGVLVGSGVAVGVGVAEGNAVFVGVMMTAGTRLGMGEGAMAVAAELPGVTGMPVLPLAKVLNAQTAELASSTRPAAAASVRKVPRRALATGTVAVCEIGVAGKTPVWPVT
jgi:hypothetical protein